MPRKPRIVLATLVGASIIGVSLTWAGATSSIVVPIGSWTAIASLGTLLTTGSLWLAYATDDERRPDWLVRRWLGLGSLAGGGAVAGLTIRLLDATLAVPALPSSVFGCLLGLVVVCVGVVASRRVAASSVPRLLVVSITACAGLALVGIALIDVKMHGGAGRAIVVRAVHLVAVGAWLGGAVWHNVVVVPALDAEAVTDIKPTVRRFRRVVPLLIVVVVATGVYQATSWLGTGLAPYATTTIGRFVVVKFVSALFLGSLVAISHLRLSESG